METQELVKLVNKYCRPCSKIRFSAYGLKCVFELITKDYITEKEMRMALKAAGYNSNRRYKLRFIDAPEVPTAFLNPRERNKRRAKNGRV